MSGKSAPLPEWEAVLSAAAHLQETLPDAVLVGDTAAAIHARHGLSPERHWHGCLADSVAATHAQHRLSQDADHVLIDLRQRFDQILLLRQLCYCSPQRDDRRPQSEERPMRPLPAETAKGVHSAWPNAKRWLRTVRRPRRGFPCCLNEANWCLIWLTGTRAPATPTCWRQLEA